MSKLNKFSFLRNLTPKDLVLALLIVVAVFSSFQVGVVRIIPQVVVGCFTAAFVDMGINYLKKTRFFFPKASLISGLIVALVLAPGSSPLVTAVAASTAIASKQFLKYKRRHIFNPASFGLVTAALIFGIYFGWWGDNLQWLVIVLGIVLVLKVRKGLQVGSFIITSIVLQFLFLKASAPEALDSLKTAFGASSWFFTFFMVSEPMTSIMPYRSTALFGLAAAVAGFSLSFVKVSLISNNSLVLGLLSANFLAFGYRYLKEKELF